MTDRRIEPPRIDDASADYWSKQLETSNDYRVLRRLPRVAQYNALAEPAPESIRHALFVDAETTGLNPLNDEIIEFAALPFTFDAVTGAIHDVQLGSAYVGYQQPKVPISAEITEITGITNEMVAGHDLDTIKIEALGAQADLIIAHNADFDRKLTERIDPIFTHRAWGCSYRELQWKQYGGFGGSLDAILAGACATFYNAHRALDDCKAGIHALATARRFPQRETDMPVPRTAFQDLLDSVRAGVFRVWALDSDYTTKDRLKARGFRWSDGALGQPKSWYRDMKNQDDVSFERTWLREHIYRGLDRARVDRISARDLYSVREGRFKSPAARRASAENEHRLFGDTEAPHGRDKAAGVG